MLSEPIAEALQTILATLEGRGLRWALAGSTSFSIRGVPLQPNDID